jgi:hypothetical protein
VDTRQPNLFQTARALTPLLDYFDQCYCENVLHELKDLEGFQTVFASIKKDHPNASPGLMLLKLRSSQLSKPQMELLKDKERLKSALITGQDSVYAQLRLRQVVHDLNETENHALRLLDTGKVGLMVLKLC